MEFKALTNVLSKNFGTIERFMRKNAPSILTGVGIAGFISTTVVACMETPHALELAHKEKEKQETYGESGVTAKAKLVISVAPAYIPAALMGAGSIACVVCANKISLSRQAALAGSLAIAQESLKDYKNELAEKLSPKQLEEIESDINQKKVAEESVEDYEYCNEKTKTTRCKDEYSGRYFWGDRDSIDKALIAFNRDLLEQGPSGLSLNDLYAHLELEPSPVGNEVGWNGQKDILHYKIDYGPDKNGNPILILSFVNDPTPNYYWDLS